MLLFIPPLSEGGKGAHLCFPSICHSSWDITGMSYTNVWGMKEQKNEYHEPQKRTKPSSFMVHVCPGWLVVAVGEWGHPPASDKGPSGSLPMSHRHKPSTPPGWDQYATWHDHTLQRLGTDLRRLKFLPDLYTLCFRKVAQIRFPIDQNTLKNSSRVGSYLKKQIQSFCDANKLPLMPICVWQIQGKSSFS